jgi:hypothetical protein
MLSPSSSEFEFGNSKKIQFKNNIWYGIEKPSKTVLTYLSLVAPELHVARDCHMPTATMSERRLRQLYIQRQGMSDHLFCAPRNDPMDKMELTAMRLPFERDCTIRPGRKKHINFLRNWCSEVSSPSTNSLLCKLRLDTRRHRAPFHAITIGYGIVHQQCCCSEDRAVLDAGRVLPFLVTPDAK